MKYTARHIQRFLETGKIDPALWKNHFPSLLPSQVPTCSDCEDYKDKTCIGDRNPVDCFLSVQPGPEEPGDQVPRSDGKRKKHRDPMLGLGARRESMPGGANKTRDQSKM
ncbi:MAG: hypothetical protein ABSB80_10765 [Methanoregula sp.]|jgi:hypothetical protein|uniref:hypothetical protein n=1 Tax=Methanoregula sp. TaxID=2052170 RepID=UPI003D0A7A40